MQKRLLIALVLLGAFSFVTPLDTADSRAQANPNDLTAQVTAFENYSKDFTAMEQPLKHGEELQILQFLDQVARTAEDRLYGAKFGLEMYDSISCKPDRAKARRILKDQLGFYSFLFESEVTRTASGLTFVKTPAAAQLGLKMKDDLRTAKEKLDAIAASLH